MEKPIECIKSLLKSITNDLSYYINNPPETNYAKKILEELQQNKKDCEIAIKLIKKHWPKEKKEKIKKEPVQKIYKKLPKKFWSPKYKCWVVREFFEDGKWIGYKFLNETTKKVLETCEGEHGITKLNKRALEIFINNTNIF